MYVWAVEQDVLSKRVLPDASTHMAPSIATTSPGVARSPAVPSSKEKDLLVPWVMTPPSAPSTRRPKGPAAKAMMPGISQPTSVSDRVLDAGSSQQLPLSVVQEGHPPTGPKPPVQAQVFQRYYHFFESQELHDLVCEAASALGLAVGSAPSSAPVLSPGHGFHNPSPPTGTTSGVEIVQEGWERSNLYIDLRLWHM